MQYKIRRVDPPARDALEHGLFGKGGAQKGSTWDNHLYIARQKVGDGWRYFYSQAELRAAQAKQAGQKAANTVGKVAKTSAYKIKKNVSDFRNYHTKADERYEKASREFSNRTDTHNKYYDQYHDPNSTAADKSKAHLALNTNWSKWIKAHEKKALAERAIKSDYYKKSLKFDTALSKVEAVANKGKDFINRIAEPVADKASSAVDKAREAATKAADKAQAAADKAKKAAEDARKVAEEAVNRAKAAIPETKAKEEAPKPVEKKSQPEPAQKQESSYPKKPDNVSEEYWEELHGPDPNKKSNNQASKPMDIRKASDEYIEDLYSNSRKNDGSGVSPELELEYNYRQASNQAKYLGRVTDTKSDAAEAALKKYGRDSQQYKKAYDEMEEAFDQLHEAEDLLRRYERERNK